MKFDNYPELINHHKEHIKIDWAIDERTGIPKKSNDKEILLAHTDATEDNLEHIIKTKLVDLIHPIGSVIMTTNPDFNPATQFGGNWTKWTDGYLKVATSPNATATGSYYITEEQLPSHKHENTIKNSAVNTTNDGGGSFKIRACVEESGDRIDLIGNKVVWDPVGDITITEPAAYGFPMEVRSNTGDSIDNSEQTVTIKPHDHWVTTNVKINNATVGGNQPYLPKYYAVIAWQRVP
jgi:hypothetical protein